MLSSKAFTRTIVPAILALMGAVALASPSQNATPPSSQELPKKTGLYEVSIPADRSSADMVAFLQKLYKGETLSNSCSAKGTLTGVESVPGEFSTLAIFIEASCNEALSNLLRDLGAIFPVKQRGPCPVPIVTGGN
jgi:hypothetical protein